MSTKVSSLANFVASKKDAAPAPLEAEKPAAPPPSPAPAAVPAAEAAPPAMRKRGRVAVQNDPADDARCTLNVRVDPAWRKSLKVYAARMGVDMSDILREGVELYRRKHGEPKD